MLNVGVTNDDHDIGRGCEFINKSCEFLIADHHRLELEASLNATELELLDDITDFLKPMNIFVFLCIVMGNNQESRSFKKYYLVSIQSIAELFKIFLKSLNIRKQEVDNLGPCFIKSLVPNGCLEAVNLKSLCLFNNFDALFIKALLTKAFCQKV